MKTIVLSIFLLINCQLHAQVLLDDLNFEKIPFKKVRHYIQEQIDNHIVSIYDLHPTLCKKIIPKEYSSQEIRYMLDENLSTVWERYVNASPAESWDGKRVSFGLLFSKTSELVVYRGGECAEIDTGQVIYLNLRILRGVYNLALAFEIINVDVKNKLIEFSYIEGNKSQGKQCIRFRPTPDNRTEIIHSSYFRSNSKIRDKFIYPYFHKRATNEFHRNMKKIIRNTSPTSAVMIDPSF